MLPEAEIGKNIRKIRESKKLTLDVLAKMIGISKGYLSKVENSDKAPPVSTIINIAKALDIGVSVLFGETQESVSFTLVKRDERPIMAREGTRFGYSYETLAHKYPYKHMEPYILTIPKGTQQNLLFQHEGEEMAMILEGSMRFLHGENEYWLEQGDCIYFDSSVPHKGFAVTGEYVKCLIVIYKP